MNTTTLTAAALRGKASAAHQSAVDSFDRCDTDGYATQAASDLNGRLYTRQAEIVEAGGVQEFPALFNLDGALVAAKGIRTRYGFAWGVLASDDPDAAIVSWFNPSAAQDPARARKANARKGYYVGTVRAAGGSLGRRDGLRGHGVGGGGDVPEGRRVLPRRHGHRQRPLTPPATI